MLTGTRPPERRFPALRRPPWRSPAGQPAWQRPLLLVTAALAALAYAWEMGRDSIEPFYGAAARSMAGSWHDFVFGAFDPAGTVTVDKLPGALWLQALSLRVSGFHIWALVLPQVAEGVLTVLILYRAVRRLAGPVAGLAAAVVMAASPVVVMLDRGNISDSLLILLLVLAADATSAALAGDGSPRCLLLAGVWVGLAFQTKMVQAWLVLPGLAAAYLVAGPAAGWRRRAAHVAAAVAVTGVVSLSWMTAVSLVPAHDRPFVDGSRDDSVYEQVFEYNGLGRLGLAGPGSVPQTAPFLEMMIRDQEVVANLSYTIRPSWHRLLSGPFGLDGGWLLPAALGGALAALFARRGRGRRDPLRAAVILWGGWFAVTAGFFSAGRYLNPYYLAALAPAVAALCAAGVAACGPRPWPTRVRLAVVAVAAVSVGYGLYLLRDPVAELVPIWAAPAALAVFAAAVTLLLLAPELPLAPVLAGVSLLVLPAAASADLVSRGLGPFDMPFESQRVSSQTQWLPVAAQRYPTLIAQLQAESLGASIFLGTDTSGLAAEYILFSGREVLPIGGYYGGVPAPTLATIQHDVRQGDIKTFLLPVVPHSTDPRVNWIESTCSAVPHRAQNPNLQFALYHCASAAGE